MKRREKVEKSERERFGRNMAQLVGGIGKEENDGEMQVERQEGEKGSSGTASRWAALRGFISQTLEQKEEFTKKA